MSNAYVLDAHAIIRHLEGNPKLGSQAKIALSDHTGRLLLPAIALAEACFVIDRGRTDIASAAAFLAALDLDVRIEIVALDRQIIERSLSLASITEMQDRQIVATALELIARGEKVALLTTDANISSSGLVPIVW